MNFAHSQELRSRSHAIIPGGAHTYAKGDDQYPEQAPAFIARGEGCHVWDVDGNQFIEYGMGLRSVTLGHANSAVNEAAYRAMQSGMNFVRPSFLEVECAEALARLVGSAQMVKFGKNGSDATTAAVKLARASTGRDMVAICADHPFFSIDDWFIGSTPMAAGIPQAVRDLTVRFRYNDIETLRALFAQYPEQIACVVLEAETADPPRDGYLAKVQSLCHEHGALMVLDEMITGFRWHIGGAQALYGIQPDLSTFGKAMGNGFPISALVGRRDVMELGGLYHDKERVFLLSTTFGAESASLAASMEVMRIYQNEPVIEHLHRQGERLCRGIAQITDDLGIQDYFHLAGRACNLIFVTRDQTKERSQAYRALFMQEMIKQGVLAPSLVVSYAHGDAEIDQTIDGVAAALIVYRQALESGVEKYLVGRPVKPVFRAYN